MLYCSRCGTQVEDGNSFCEVCGARIVTLNSRSSSAPPSNSPYAPPSHSPYAPPSSSPYAPPSSSPYAPPSSSPYAPPYATATSTQLGYPAYNSQWSPMKQQELIRTESLEEMNKLIRYFSVKQDRYDEYDACIEQSEYLSKPNAHVKAKLGPDGSVFLVLGIVFTAVLYVAMVTAFAYAASSKGSYGWGIVLGLFPFLLISLASLIFGARCKARNNRILKKARADLLRETQEKFDRIVDELYQYYVNYGYCPTSPSYTNPKILEKIRDNIWNGRADTIKEAINILHQDAHNSEMELQAQLATKAAQLTARYTASTARSAKATMFFTAGNFIFK